MDVFTAVKGRRSIRKFLKKDIPEDVLDKLVDALIWAPSAGNLQSRKFFFVRDEKTKGRLASAALNQGFVSDAPVVIVCCADIAKASGYGQRGIELYAIQDVAASVMAMMLVAYEEGLGTCWVGAFKDEEVSKVLNLGNSLRPVAIVPVGYPAKIPKPTSRVSRQEAVEFR
ncbi:MAG: nitroreductase family protein [Nitrospirota bacterium]